MYTIFVDGEKIILYYFRRNGARPQPDPESGGWSVREKESFDEREPGQKASGIPGQRRGYPGKNNKREAVYMSKVFSEEEMKVRCVIPGARGRIDMPVFSAPITAKENMKRAIYDKNPLFMPSYRYYQNFTPRVVPDIEARGFIMDGGAPAQHPEGFKDMFGINWLFIPVAGGSMVEPGNPLMTDMNEWEEKVVWPDIDSWDWTGQAELSKEFIKQEELALVPTLMTGYFERMISMMDFEGAAMALIDEEQQEAVHGFLDKLADLYCRIIDKYLEYFPGIDGFTVHDDWGSQRAPFFSLDTVREMLVPPLSKVVKHVHSKGLFYDMHCCGQVEALLPAMIEAGVDSWSGQPMNDKAMLYHKYGKEILIGVETPDIPEDMPDAQVDEIAKKYVEEFMVPGAPAMIGFSSQILNPYFFEAVYRYSREKAGE